MLDAKEVSNLDDDAKILARVLGLGIRVIGGYGGTVLYGITTREHTHITYKTPYTFYGTKPYKKKKVS